MNRIYIIGIVFILSLFSVSAITLNNVTLTATNSNTTIYVGEAINSSLITITSNNIQIKDFQYNNSKEFWLTPIRYINTNETFDWNFNKSNTYVNTSNFVHYFQFNLTNNGSLISNFKFGDFNVVGNQAKIWFENMGVVGVKNWVFEKFGYLTSTFGFNFSYNTFNNITYNVNFATITINIKDKSTTNLINDSNFTVQLISNIGNNTWTTNGSITFQNLMFQPGEYTIIISNENYYTEQLFFTYSNQEVINQDIYMTLINDTNAGLVQIQVVDGLGQGISGAIVQALQWDSTVSSFIRVSEGLTGLDGKASLNVILEDKIYIFRTTVNNETVQSPQYRLLLSDNNKLITLVITAGVGERTFTLSNFNSNTYQVSYINNISTLRVDWVNTDGIEETVCFGVYRYKGVQSSLIDRFCQIGVSEQFIQAFNIDSNYNIRIVSELHRGDSIIPLKTFNYPKDRSFSNIIEGLSLSMFVIPLLFFGVIAVAILTQNINIGAILLIIVAGISLSIVPSLITGGIVAFLFIVSGLIMWATIGGRR